MDNILPFYGGILSQWYPCTFKGKAPVLGMGDDATAFQVDDGEFNCAEQFMMMGKAAIFNDDGVAEQLYDETDPAVMKKLGRSISGFDEDVWVKSRLGIVYLGNYMKFSQNPKLKNYLLATQGKILVEASPDDRIWGVGLSQVDIRIKNPKLWQGQNLLGFTLMKVRAALYHSDQFDKSVSKLDVWKDQYLP